MTPTEIVQILCAAVMPIAVIGICWNRIRLRRGFGVRAIQWLGVSMLVPATVILTLDDKISGEAAIAVIGALAGYLFASISKFDDRETD